MAKEPGANVGREARHTFGPMSTSSPQAPDTAARRVLITDGVDDLLPRGLEQLGYRIDYEPDIALSEVRERIAEYEGLVINSKILVDEGLLVRAPRLRWVGRLGSGLEIVDRPAASARGVAVISSPEGNAPAVGEHALAMVLHLACQLQRGQRQVMSLQDWDREACRGWELSERTVGIIGFGHTGPAFARVLRGFGCRVLAHDKYRSDIESRCPWVKSVDDPDELIARSEVLSLHLPLTQETRGYLDARRLALLPSGAVVINTSRGLALDLDSLVLALESGRLGGAGLDVFPCEKPATYSSAERAVMLRLTQLPNVVLTPHVAGWTDKSKRELAQIILDRVEQLDKTHQTQRTSG